MRIASLISSATEILYAMGLGDCVVAISHECDYPAQVADKPRVTRSLIDDRVESSEIDHQVQTRIRTKQALYEIDEQKLSQSGPDLIVTQAQCDVCAVRYDDVMATVRRSAQLANTRVLALNPQSLPEVLDDIADIGAAACGAAQADMLLSQLRARIESVRQLTDPVPREHRPRVALIEWIDPLMLSGNWLPEMVQWAGGRHELTTAGRHSPYVDWENLMAYDPQVVIIMPCGFDLARTVRESPALTARPGWSRMSAAKNKRVFAADGSAYFNRSGPRLVDSLEILAHLLHPDVVPLTPSTQYLDRAWRRLE